MERNLKINSVAG